MIKIIGGSGFVGTRLSTRLRKNNKEFSIIDKAMSQSFSKQCDIADVRDLDSLNRCLNKGDVIINLAAEHKDNVMPKSLYDDVNVQGARNVCEAAEKAKIEKIIFTSSVAVYGFAPRNTDETGEFNPFNDYGRTKLEAEYVYKEWQEKDPENRTLVIIRPTVIFGEQNRGNVYNLLNQIASGKFMMIGNGKNKKSMAYVENIAALLEFSLDFEAGVHIYNYIDKEDLDMNTLVEKVQTTLDKKRKINLHLPYFIGYSIGKVFDIWGSINKKTYTISAIRVKKFCSDSVFDTSIASTGFKPEVKMEEGLERTITYEFIENNKNDQVFYTE